MTTSGTAPIFYVYEHWRPDNGTCFYVGKGHRDRAYSMKGRNSHHKAIIAKLGRLGLSIEVRIHKADLTETDAFALECERIAFWRSIGDNLVNRTNGGDGVRGHLISEEQRRKISEANRGKRRSAETRARMSAAFKGRVLSEEAKRHLSEVNKGRPAAFRGRHHTDETKRVLSEKGRVRGAPILSAEAIERIATFHRGRKRSPETCAKIAAKALGRPSPTKGKPSPLKGVSNSEEVKAKKKIAALQIWAKRKAEHASGNVQ